MSIIKLEPTDLEIIKTSIQLRRKSWAENPKLISKLDDIQDRLNFFPIDLKPLQRATLIGCIREFIIIPNGDLFDLSDYEVFCSIDDVEERMRKVDVGLNAMNKLKMKREKAFRTFENTIEKVNQLMDKDIVYFSETDDGKIYKFAIIGKNGTGMRIEAEGSALEYFELGNISADSYMKSASPKEVIAKLEVYGQKNTLTENQIRAKEILRREVCI